MACRIATTYRSRAAYTVGVALVSVLIGLALARAQGAPPPPAGAPNDEASPLSKACQAGGTVVTEQSPLPNVAAALAKRKTLRILALGAAPGHVSAHDDSYTELIEAMLEHALKDIDVVMINRGVGGELAANAATRMKNEVALARPDLVLWQVGTNDALAYVPAAEFAATVTDQIHWLKAHKVDVVLVGLQFAKSMLRDEHYKQVRDALRNVGADENVIVIRFYEAMAIVEQAAANGPEAAADIERNEAGYNCLAQYVARAITLGVFARSMPKRP